MDKTNILIFFYNLYTFKNNFKFKKILIIKFVKYRLNFLFINILIKM